MGIFSLTQKPSGPLQPFHPPLGVNTSYCVPNVVTLVLKEKAFSFSGDDFQIKDSNGNVVVQCHGSAMSFRDKKEIRDTSGRVLFKLETKLLSLLKSFFATGPDGKELFQVKKKFSIGSNKMVTYFTNASDGAPIELDLKGNFWGGSAEILLGGRTVATISRQVMNMREIFVDKQTYFVTVAPGVDLAMIVAVCICLDEAENEQ
ncbi:tubby C-terminal-like domain-containing protein [Mrakia frigida]|uniref:LURP-one-related/scramblase family protein n=1 Tax=Mrakia frigida TaxID=29902 RepID=UPI003FCC1F97